MKRMFVVAAIVTGASTGVTATAVSAAPVCVAQLASSARGDMRNVAADWRNDFLGLDQPAGWYAVHIAQTTTNCP